MLCSADVSMERALLPGHGYCIHSCIVSLLQGSFKSSLRKKRKSSVKRKKGSCKDNEIHRPFIVKPIPSPLLKPILVFINPKSGGNQGAKLMHKFCWLLNPRQVFDLSHGGPKLG